MDESSNNCSKIQGLLLDVVKNKLNLMLSEVCQLCTQEQPVGLEDNQVLVKTVLKKIAEQKIKSVHITAEEASCFIQIFDEMNSGSHVEKYRFMDKDNQEKGKSVYLDSPFK